MPIIKKNKTRRIQFILFNQIIIWLILNNIILLTWIGACPVESPFIIVGQVLTITYFSYYVIDPIISKKWEHSSIMIK
jgi:ubiquinol-cytochrome c reductase cytochrome b subunit